MQINTDRFVSLIAMLIGSGRPFIIVDQTARLRELSGTRRRAGTTPSAWRIRAPTRRSSRPLTARFAAIAGV